MEVLLDNIELVIFAILFCVGYFAGSVAEAKHYKSIDKRERDLVNQPSITLKGGFDPNAPSDARLVMGSVVISVDYFKRILAALRNIVGGSVSSYETLVDRARREAVLRMKEQAKDANIIVNVRLETSSIGQSSNRRNAVGSIEAIAYGTAITPR